MTSAGDIRYKAGRSDRSSGGPLDKREALVLRTEPTDHLVDVPQVKRVNVAGVGDIVATLPELLVYGFRVDGPLREITGDCHDSENGLADRISNAGRVVNEVTCLIERPNRHLHSPSIPTDFGFLPSPDLFQRLTLIRRHSSSHALDSCPVRERAFGECRYVGNLQSTPGDVASAVDTSTRSPPLSTVSQSPWVQITGVTVTRSPTPPHGCIAKRLPQFNSNRPHRLSKRGDQYCQA